MSGSQPYDIRFERDGDDILFKLDEFDVVRRIHMDTNGDRSTQPFSIHGLSTGHWDGDALVVETTNLNSPNFKLEIPASAASQPLMQRLATPSWGPHMISDCCYTF
jgi:hypothetical protein